MRRRRCLHATRKLNALVSKQMTSNVLLNAQVLCENVNELCKWKLFRLCYSGYQCQKISSKDIRIKAGKHRAYIDAGVSLHTSCIFALQKNFCPGKSCKCWELVLKCFLMSVVTIHPGLKEHALIFYNTLAIYTLAFHKMRVSKLPSMPSKIIMGKLPCCI